MEAYRADQHDPSGYHDGVLIRGREQGMHLASCADGDHARVDIVKDFPQVKEVGKDSRATP